MGLAVYIDRADMRLRRERRPVTSPQLDLLQIEVPLFLRQVSVLRVFRIVAGVDFGDAHCQQLLATVAEAIAGTLVDVLDAAVEVEHDDHVRASFNQTAIALLALAQGLLRRLPLADVGDERDAAADLAVLVTQRGGPGSGFYRRSVLPYASRLVTTQHLAPAHALHVSLEFVHLVGRQAKRPLADQLLLLPAEDLLSRRVQPQDPALAIQKEDGERGSADERLQRSCRLGQRLLTFVQFLYQLLRLLPCDLRLSERPGEGAKKVGAGGVDENDAEARNAGVSAEYADGDERCEGGNPHVAGLLGNGKHRLYGE